MVNFWLDMGVDGFRCDVINNISKDLSAPLGYGPHLHEYLHELYGAGLSATRCADRRRDLGIDAAATLASDGEGPR